MKRETLAIDEIIIALSSMPNHVKGLAGKGKNYDLLLIEILKYESEKEKSHLPSSRELQQRTKLDAQKVKKQLVEIYNDFLASMGTELQSYSSTSIICEFDVHFLDRSKRFYAHLPFIPRIGEQVQLSFLKPIFHIDVFHVKSVSHVLKEEHQLIEIYLEGNPENSYEKFVTDKEEFDRKKRIKRKMENEI